MECGNIGQAPMNLLKNTVRCEDPGILQGVLRNNFDFRTGGA